MDRAHDLKAALSFHDHPLAKQAVERIAELEAALRKIAAPTYGTELNDTDAERADCYWTHLQRFQDIARKALGS